jgi:hypothetical protein
MSTTRQIPTAQNNAWGFFGTMNEQACAAWPLAMTAIAEATGEPLESVRIFLDSRHGRHFADAVLDQLFAGHPLPNAIAAATRQWMSWTIGQRTSRTYGIPKGLPYLTGFVIHCAIFEESLAA